jgi:NADPH-dependent glutamate synthase beta subunit-like oxidoreductase
VQARPGREAQAPPEPVAICRLKRVAADFKDDITSTCRGPARNGKRIACVGAGRRRSPSPAIWLLGYDVVVFDGDAQAGGMIRSQIPRFRLPEEVIDEETGYVLKLASVSRRHADRLHARLLADSWDAAFVGSGRRAAAISTFLAYEAARIHMASTGCRRCPSATSRRSASASSSSAAATRRWTAAAARGASAGATSR